ncbi:hypothetical protein Ancab_037851 [Ancistrocladus abbreviatus]
MAMFVGSCGLTMLVIISLTSQYLGVEGQQCKPSGILVCHPPPGRCNAKDDSECCVQGHQYKTYTCSPPVTSQTPAILTLNSFEAGGDGGGHAECDTRYHDDRFSLVALSTGWYNRGSRCERHIIINGNGRSVRIEVVDECDSKAGCDAKHPYQPPCWYNNVDASRTVWERLGVPQDRWGEMQNCRPTGYFRGTDPPAGKCDSDCCKAGQVYFTFQCSPDVSAQTNATLTLKSFQEGGGGGGPSKCDNKYHSDDTPVVALSTGWYGGGKRCGKEIIIRGNGRSVRAKVVDECDSTMGCDEKNGYQPPCSYNIVDASRAVWKALGLPENQWGQLDITWSDA